MNSDFLDFAKGDPVMSYIHCFFKVLPRLDLILPEVNGGPWAE